MLQQGALRRRHRVLLRRGHERHGALPAARRPPIPAGYNFDYVNADALMHRFGVADGRLATPSGMRYRVLALDPNSRHMSLPVLRKIGELVAAGAVVVGRSRSASPSLSDDEAEFRRLADDLWGAGDGGGEHRTEGHGDGDARPSAVLSRLQVPPDFVYTKPKADTTSLFVHRTLPDADVYFVNNRQDRDEDLEATFRVSGRRPRSGTPTPDGANRRRIRIAGDRTTVPLHLDPWGAVFVVFRKPASAPSRTIAAPAERSHRDDCRAVGRARSRPDRGAPDTITLDTLKSWSDERGCRGEVLFGNRHLHDDR